MPPFCMSIGIQLRVAEDRETLVRQSYRLPKGQVDKIKLLAQNKIFGTNKSAIVRTLLDRAFAQLTEAEHVRKHFEEMKALRKGGL